jgi:uncharacterized protein YdeI (YjbR/CyaY-like superfamily)
MMTQAGLAKITEAKQNDFWNNAYSDQVRVELPPDLKEALVKEATAWQHFRQFANTYWNMYIRWVTGAKAAITRKTDS